MKQLTLSHKCGILGGYINDSFNALIIVIILGGLVHIWHVSPIYTAQLLLTIMQYYVLFLLLKYLIIGFISIPRF